MAEIELKFSLPRAKTAPRAAVAALARLKGAGAPTTERLDSVYFDTTAHDLHRAGVTLRVRKEKAISVQTVKCSGGGLIARGEWTDEIDHARPDLGRGKSGRKVRGALKRAGKSDAVLWPLFHVAVSRTRIPLKHGRARIEAAVDVGSIIVPHGRRTAVAELELELKSGTDAAVLYETALKLPDSLGLRLEGHSKSDRGYALISGDAPGAVRAGPVDTGGRAALGSVLRDAGRVYIGQFIANMTAADSAETVHQMRVALRRLRGILKVAEKALPAPQYAWVNARFKQVLAHLGAARNWDVLCASLAEAPDLPHRRTAAHRSLLAMAQRRRREAHRQAAAYIASPALTRTVLEIGRWFEHLAQPAAPDLAAPAKTASRTLLDRALKRLRKKGRDFEDLNADGRHKLRIAGKNMRYAAELFASLYDAKAVKRFLRGLKTHQDLLGALNDIRGAHALLAPAQVPRNKAAAGAVLGWFDHKALTLEKRAAKAVEKLRKSRGFW